MGRPPFQITEKSLDLSFEIASHAGKIEGMSLGSSVAPHLRKQNQVKTIQGSLAIEGNTLSLEQVTAILEGKRVRGSTKEILEVQNSIELYDKVLTFSHSSLIHFKKAHKVLMKGLVKDAGHFRTTNVGIIKGKAVQHIAPKPSMVLSLMKDLFRFIKEDATHMLIKSAVVHYEIEFIHPFLDGNGRMGRFWQHLMLVQLNPIFTQIPFESVIKEQQKTYYEILAHCDKKGSSTEFIIFSLEVIKQALERYEKECSFQTPTVEDRLAFAKEHFSGKYFSRKDYILLCKTISSATASRDLKFGIDKKLLSKSGERARTLYKFLTSRTGEHTEPKVH